MKKVDQLIRAYFRVKKAGQVQDAEGAYKRHLLRMQSLAATQKKGNVHR